MSLESAVAFYERLERDSELREKLKELGSKKNVERYVREDLGYVFSNEEMQKVVFEKNPEMSDEDLEAVVGGGEMTGDEIVCIVFVVGAAVAAA
jgi:predicted ribosomally synthesized peptide with nif11-like leader